jgi:hypothetical protein
MLICSFALCTAAALVIWFFVDIPKGRAQAVAFAIEERGATAETRVGQVSNAIGSSAVGKH